MLRTKTLLFILCSQLFFGVFAQSNDSTQLRLPANQHYNAIGLKSSSGISYRHHFGHIVLENNLSSIAFSGFYGFSLRGSTMVLFQYNSKHWFQPYIGGGINTGFYAKSEPGGIPNDTLLKSKITTTPMLFISPVLILGFEIIAPKPTFSFCADIVFNFSNKIRYEIIQFNLGIKYRFTLKK